jgi:hypothetical protein
MQNWLAIVFLLTTAQMGRSDTNMIVPPYQGVQGTPPQTGTQFPFLISQTFPSGAITNMRYQQVYNSSLFTNLDPSLIYITSLSFLSYTPYGPYLGTPIPKMQVNLSTTSKRADGLS